MTPDELRAAQDAAIEAAAASGRTIEPTVGGLGGRAAAEHDRAIAALDAGDIDAAIGAEMLADALTAAALADG